MKQSLAVAKHKVEELSSVSTSEPRSTNPLAGLGGLGDLGGMDFASMMGNPDFMKMGRLTIIFKTKLNCLISFFYDE